MFGQTMDPDKTTEDYFGRSILWRRDEWRDPKTGELLSVEVTPEGDLKLHISSQDCDCIPSFQYPGGIPMLIHNSFDGRENNSERGN